jgi:uncharacterized cupredoxin-like copper-binding protein
MTTSIRWWMACAFAHTPLASKADRIQARALVASFALMVLAVIPAALVSQQAYDVRSQAVAAQIKATHSVEATAVGNSTALPSATESASTTFLTPVRWSAQDGVHETTTKGDEPVKAGAPVQIWVNEQGKVTSPPPNQTDAKVDSLGMAALAWLTMAAVIGAAMAALRSVLNRTRDREWDRGLRELAGYGGGSTTRTP